MFIAKKTEDGKFKGKISFYCKYLDVTRQGFHSYLKHKNKPWKYQGLADRILDIRQEDECNDTYGRIRMYQALQLKIPRDMQIPSERTVYRIMEHIGISHKRKRTPNGITKSDNTTRKSEDLIKRNFKANKPLEKYGIRQSMNNASGRYLDNAKCKSMWARLKEELLYNRYKPSKITIEKMKTEKMKTLIWRYFLSYWNNRRICSSNGGLPPLLKRDLYYRSLKNIS